MGGRNYCFRFVFFIDQVYLGLGVGVGSFGVLFLLQVREGFRDFQRGCFLVFFISGFGRFNKFDGGFVLYLVKSYGEVDEISLFVVVEIKYLFQIIRWVQIGWLEFCEG